MALLWIDGFDSYGTTVGSGESPSGIIERKYGAYESPTFAIQAGRVADHSLQLTQANSHLTLPTTTANATLVVGLGVRFTAIVDSTFLCLTANSDGGTPQVDLRVTAAGELAVYLSGSLSATTSGLGLQAGTWYYITLKAVCGTTGSYAVYNGGTLVLNASNINTKGAGNAYYFYLWLEGGATGLTPTYDDLYLLDGTGSVNNDVLGVMRVVTLRPSAAGNSTQWSPSSGANYAAVNEAVCDAAGNVSTQFSSRVDLYQYADLPASVSWVAGVMVTTQWTAGGSFGAATLFPVCLSGATQQTIGAGQYRETYYGYGLMTQMVESDPNTSPSSTWTVASLNAAQFGFTATLW